MRWPLLFLTASPWPCAGLTYAGPYSTSFPYTMRGFASHVTIPANTNMLSSPARHQQLFPSCSSQHCTGLEVFTFATATARGCIVGATCSPHWVINEPHIQAQDPKKSEGREEKKNSTAASMETGEQWALSKEQGNQAPVWLKST